MWGKKKRVKKEISPFVSFWSQNTRKKHKKRGDKEKQIFSEKAKFSLFGAQIYIKSISRETSLLLNLLCIVCVCAFSALLERERVREREK